LFGKGCRPEEERYFRSSSFSSRHCVRTFEAASKHAPCHACLWTVCTYTRKCGRYKKEFLLLLFLLIDLKKGLTPVHLAAIFNRAKILEWLLDQGAEADDKDDYAGLPLHKVERFFVFVMCF
jgi:ankyrin repeat protein